MGLFRSKKKTAAADTSAPPSPSLATPNTVTMQLSPRPSRPTIRLRVITDPLTVGPSSANASFCVDVDPESDMDALRGVISEQIGALAMDLFKVCIPCLALEQANEYTRRYKERVDLVNHFPAYSLDDIQQLRRSLGPAGWSAQLPPAPLVSHWWPLPPSDKDFISIIVRTISWAPNSSRPLTLLAHFAPTDTSSSLSSASSSPSNKSNRRPPAAVNVLPEFSIGELKAAILAADGRPVDKLEKVVLWKVEMSEQEMVVIEERGGLRSGQMPWPYPPTAEVPVALSNDSLTVSHYFPDARSNPSMVSLSVWIHPSATVTLAHTINPDALEAPPFRYPMVFPPELRRASASHSLPARSPTPDPEIAMLASTLPSKGSNGRMRRARPTTAPPTVDSAEGSPHPNTFGGLRAFRAGPGPSPLAQQPRIKGLGIAGQPISIKEIGSNANDVAIATSDFGNLSLKVDVGESSLDTAGDGQGKIIWHAAESGSMRRSDSSQSRIRSVAHARSLRAYEIC